MSEKTYATIAVFLGCVIGFFIVPLFSLYYAYFTTLIISTFNVPLSITLHQVAGIFFIFGMLVSSVRLGLHINKEKLDSLLEAIKGKDYRIKTKSRFAVQSIVWAIITPLIIWLLSAIYSWYFL